MIRNSVVLPQPEGPTRAPTSPLPSEKVRPSMTRRVPPVAALKALCLTETSSRPRSPTGDMSFNWLHQERFEHQHHGDEGESIGENSGHVEQLERGSDLEAHSAGAPEQLDNEHELPYQRQPGAGSGRKIGGKLRQHHVAHAHPGPHAEYLRHVVEPAVERARALAYSDGRDRQLVECDCSDRGGLGEARPHI